MAVLQLLNVVDMYYSDCVKYFNYVDRTLKFIQPTYTFYENDGLRRIPLILSNSTSEISVRVQVEINNAVISGKS